MVFASNNVRYIGSLNTLGPRRDTPVWDCRDQLDRLSAYFAMPVHRANENSSGV